MQISLIERAARIAVDAHKEQVRKSDRSPYVVHPFMCAMFLMRHGFPDKVVAAALVHDVLEDTSMDEKVLQEQLGDEVLRIVHTVSEDKTLPWEERKKQYVETVRQGGEGAWAVSLADKIHNAQSLLTAHERDGATLWAKFNRGKDQKLWFEHLMLTMLREVWQHPLLDEYEDLITRIEALD